VLDDDPGASTSDRQRLTLRTGPRFQLTGEAFGPRLQPYLEFEAVRVPDAATTDYDAVKFGSGLPERPQRRLDQFRRRLHRLGRAGRSGADIDFHDLSLGVTYRPSREALYRLTLSLGSEDTVTRDEDERGPALDYGRDFGGPAMLPAPTGAPAPSRRSTGATSPIPAWPATRP
jgi:hypothetical protein